MRSNHIRGALLRGVMDLVWSYNSTLNSILPNDNDVRYLAEEGFIFDFDAFEFYSGSKPGKYLVACHHGWYAEYAEAIKTEAKSPYCSHIYKSPLSPESRGGSMNYRCFVVPCKHGYWQAFCIDLCLHEIAPTAWMAKTALTLQVEEFHRECTRGEHAPFCDKLLNRSSPKWIIAKYYLVKALTWLGASSTKMGTTFNVEVKDE